MKNVKWLWYVCLAVVSLLVTFFGIGPVVFADGGMGERVLTLAVVIVIYIVIGVVFIRIKNQGR
ncbi:MAG: hypothetical protein K0R09_3125 [Clostridiales bacterium]|nr:hypothetical protein [Clostridiales bacterium]